MILPAAVLGDSAVYSEDSYTAKVEISKEVKTSRKKIKKQKKLDVAEGEQGQAHSERLENFFAEEGAGPSVPKTRKEAHSFLELKRKENKVKNIHTVLSSFNSEKDVKSFLIRETKQRSLTNCLDDKQWTLLKNLVGKLNCKLRNAGDETKKRHILEQIRKAFQIALS